MNLPEQEKHSMVRLHALAHFRRDCCDVEVQEQPRILGLDIGDRRIGLAISDPFGTLAQPLLTLVRSSLRHDLKSIGRVLRKHGVAEIVAGNPLYMSGDQSPQAAKAQSFAEAVRAEFGLPLYLWDERLTTTEAHRQLDSLGHEKMGRKGIIDQVAAVLILQAWLDYRRLQAGQLEDGQVAETG